MRVSRRRRRINARCRSASVAHGRRVTDVVIGQRRRTTQARRSAGSWKSGAYIASLIDVGGLVGKRPFAIQSTALAGNELTSLLLGHVLLLAAAAALMVRVVARNGDISDSISLILLLRVQIAELPLSLSCHPSLSLHDLLGFIRTTRGLVSLGGVKVVQVSSSRGPARLVEAVHRVGARATVRRSAVEIRCASSGAGTMAAMVHG